ncbi:hypothetical protein GCM10010279_50440 [Streptomyces mutabilis]|nr:hypothetical protein GCM10010279_50440 [Streptomyces mutabilis]
MRPGRRVPAGSRNLLGAVRGRGATAGAETDATAWADLARPLGPGQVADMFSSPATPPPDRKPVFESEMEGRQMIRPGTGRFARTEDETGMVERGADDVPEILGLVDGTGPGPFWARTRELHLPGHPARGHAGGDGGRTAAA